MIYSRYGGAAKDVLNLEYDEGMDILRVAYEQIAEDRLYARWIQGYDREIDFAAFKNRAVKHQSKQESAETTLSRVEQILGMKVKT